MYVLNPVATIESLLSSHDRILAAARALFARQGYQQTSTVQVARQAGTSESQLVKHFGSKEGLLEAIFDLSWRGLNARAAEIAAAHRDAVRRIKALTTVMLVALESDPELKTLMLLEGRRIRKGGDMVMLTLGFRTFVHTIDGWLEEAQRHGQFRRRLPVTAVRALVIGAFEGLLREQLFASPDYPADYSAQDVQQALDALLDAFLKEK